ncbi:MAG: protein kinase [Verrucomicrobia bacterium]|nr:protein kinase [Verrucomicrobiota bacterium]
MNTIRLCPKCRQPLPADAPEGLCPACLLSLGSSFANPPAPGPDSYAEPPATATQDPVPGTRLGYVGDYELLEEIARGGMGVVYRARQSSLKRIVAVKMIRSGELAGDAEVKRFRAEAEAAANLKHPNIVAIHEIGEHEGRHYFSMDLVEGKNLAQFTSGKPVAARQAAEWLKAIAEAVQFAHQRGVLHRDLKPQNILVDAEGRPHVTDFGLAKNLQADSGVTQTGAVMGSPSYMAPEQARGRNDLVGPASDVYSLGAVLYELLTGRAPFVAETPLETLRKVVGEEPERPSKLNPNVSPDLETICLKCLEKNSARRYATARDLAEELGRLLNQEPIHARRASPVRRGWSWFIRHPWMVSGAASLLVLLTVGFAYRMWERVDALEWQHTHPGQILPFNTDYFFPSWLAVFLGFEFFLLQTLPVSLFLQLRSRRVRGKGFYHLFAVAGTAQALFGLEILRRAVANQAWNPDFKAQLFFASVAALTNAWFGSALTWKALREARLDLPGVAASEEPAEQPLTFTNRRLIEWAVALELLAGVGVFGLGMMSLLGGKTNLLTADAGIACLFGSVGMLGMTFLVLIGHLIHHSRGLERQSRLPALIVAMIIVAMGLIGFATPAWYLTLTFYLAGLLVGMALRKRCPLQRGEAPVQEAGSRPSVSALWHFFWRKRTTYAAAILVTLVTLFYIVENWRGGREWQLVKGEFASAGVPLDPAAYRKPRVPDEENVMMHPFMQTHYIRGKMGIYKDIPSFGMKGFSPFELKQLRTLPREGTNDASLQGILRWYSQHREVFDQLEEALRRPHSQLVTDLTRPDEITLPNSASYRWFYFAYINRCKVNLLLGNADDALKDLQWLRRLMDAFPCNNPPTIVESVLRTAGAGGMASTIEETLAGGLWPATHLEQIQRLCADANLIGGFTAGASHEILARLYKYESEDIHTYSLGFIVPSGWIDRNKTDYVGAMAPVFNGLNPIRQRVDSQIIERANWDAHTGAGYMRPWIVELRPYPLTKSIFLVAKNQTLMNQAFIACALERHRAAKGACPDTLNALVPLFAAKLPHDLFDGQPLRYRRTDDGRYLLYSIGWNSTDDGGGIALDKNQQPEWAKDRGDWVWNGVPAAKPASPN